MYWDPMNNMILVPDLLSQSEFNANPTKLSLKKMNCNAINAMLKKIFINNKLKLRIIAKIHFKNQY